MIVGHEPQDIMGEVRGVVEARVRLVQPFVSLRLEKRGGYGYPSMTVNPNHALAVCVPRRGGRYQGGVLSGSRDRVSIWVALYRDNLEEVIVRSSRLAGRGCWWGVVPCHFCRS